MFLISSLSGKICLELHVSIVVFNYLLGSEEIIHSRNSDFMLVSFTIVFLYSFHIAFRFDYNSEYGLPSLADWPETCL